VQTGVTDSVWAVVVAAGSGARFGAAKQFALLGGRPVIDWSIDAAHGTCDGVVVVIPEGTEPPRHADAVVVGGSTRSQSVRNGLDAVPATAGVIVVHDAVRPLAGPELFIAVVAAVREGADAAVCAIAVTDTIRGPGGTIDRDGLWAVQTPQAFRASAIRAAHATGGAATDDATLVERAGGRVVIVAGHARNIKVTHPHDLAVAALLAGCES
jgi:2-C-methyl-D-erythritol 4-phosphate cytidylyltransferase